MEALQHYDRSKELGYVGHPEVGEALELYRIRELHVSYAPLQKSDQTISIPLRGNSLGSQLLRQDTVNTIQFFNEALAQGTAQSLEVNFLGWQGDQIWFERWVVKEGEGRVHAYSIRFTMIPVEGGTDITIVEDAAVPDFEGEREVL